MKERCLLWERTDAQPCKNAILAVLAVINFLKCILKNIDLNNICASIVFTQSFRGKQIMIFALFPSKEVLQEKIIQ